MICRPGSGMTTKSFVKIAIPGIYHLTLLPTQDIRVTSIQYGHGRAPEKLPACSPKLYLNTPDISVRFMLSKAKKASSLSGAPPDPCNLTDARERGGRYILEWVGLRCCH